MARPKILLKEILTKQEWELIRDLYIERKTTQTKCKAEMGEQKFNRVLDSALNQIFPNADAREYLLNHVSKHFYNELYQRYMHGGKEVVTQKNTLQVILTEEEYQLIQDLYFFNPKSRKTLQDEMGMIVFCSIHQSALRKIFKSSSAKEFLMNHITWARFKMMQREYHELPADIGLLNDSKNPYVIRFLSEMSVEFQIIAQKYLGIGTGKFFTMQEVQKILLSAGFNVNNIRYAKIVKEILESIVRNNFTESFVSLLRKCDNGKVASRIMKKLEEVHEEWLHSPKEDDSILYDRDELEKLREKARVNVNVKRGYLFGDELLNVSELSESKAMTIKSMTHHEGLLRISKKCSFIGGMKTFLAIAIFINFENDEKFTPYEIASITGLSIEEVNDILHTKVGDFIALLPESLQQEQVQKLNVYKKG